jgi:hypothetical protein
VFFLKLQYEAGYTILGLFSIGICKVDDFPSLHCLTPFVIAAQAVIHTCLPRAALGARLRGHDGRGYGMTVLGRAFAPNGLFAGLFDGV